MKKLLLLILTLILSGCYLANGSPSLSKFWLKNGKSFSMKERDDCLAKADNVLGERFFYLRKKDNEDSDKFYETPEYQEFLVYLKKESRLMNKCFYDLGYRFQAPLYWCLAQDGDNTKICIENMKYRN